jgi:NTP pyrophosphatase (non-canonical NTP hydrolase)
MQLNNYQDYALSTAIFKKPEDALIVCLLGLAGESGEVFEKCKKNITHTTVDGSPKFSNSEIAKELGDVLWYLAVLANELGYSLEDIAQMNINKLNARKIAKTLVSGTGDNR